MNGNEIEDMRCETVSKNQMNYSVNDVLEVRFRQSFRGYNQDDVDVFLDRVIEDYAAYKKEIERLNQEIEKLKKGYGYKP
jgi:DivIVA domain-containing protein